MCGKVVWNMRHSPDGNGHVLSRLRDGRQELERVIARGDSYTFIAAPAPRSQDLLHVRNVGDTSLTLLTNFFQKRS